jgi:hypothetical protein
MRCLKLYKHRLLRILLQWRLRHSSCFSKLRKSRFITQLMAIMSKYFFSNNCYNDLMKPISDILLKQYNVPKDMYQSKKMMSALGLRSMKIDMWPESYMLFWKEHANEKKCLECGQSRFIEVVI